ncbi:MAG: bifunctional tetrahydrofolate synthase/dihydrofolate synthase [Gammaproteobacteria bacterium]
MPDHSAIEVVDPTPRCATLPEWLAWQEGLHLREIDLGLERCQGVAKRLGLRAPSYRVISVGGTNGKGSSVALLEAILRAAGLRVATYTSPHLLRYNERIRVNGVAAEDEAICGAFERVDAARAGTSLTYFEFGTLAALDLFQRQAVDVAVLEVGLGGRLDAVNIVDADVALVAAIDIDHTEWLGPDRASIAREKAGIFRRGRSAVCSDPQPPHTLIEHAEVVGAPLFLSQRDYRYESHGALWSWWSNTRHLSDLPRPALLGDYQLQNAAGVLMALEQLAPGLSVGADAIRQGLASVRLSGRFEILPGAVEHILDVAHNPQAARALAANLAARAVAGETHAVLGILRDKDSRGVFAALQGVVDRWYLASLGGTRGTDSRHLLAVLEAVGVTGAASFRSPGEALAAAQARARDGARIVVTGSFLTVAAALHYLDRGERSERF